MRDAAPKDPRAEKARYRYCPERAAWLRCDLTMTETGRELLLRPLVLPAVRRLRVVR